MTEPTFKHRVELCGKPDVPPDTPLKTAQVKDIHCKCCDKKMTIVQPKSLSMQQLGIYALICNFCSKSKKKKRRKN